MEMSSCGSVFAGLACPRQGKHEEERGVEACGDEVEKPGGLDDVWYMGGACIGAATDQEQDYQGSVAMAMPVSGGGMEYLVRAY